jgi:hypothetical protein
MGRIDMKQTHGSRSVGLLLHNSNSFTTMSAFDALIEFVAKEDQESYFALMTYRNDDMTGAQLV